MTASQSLPASGEISSMKKTFRLPRQSRLTVPGVGGSVTRSSSISGAKASCRVLTARRFERLARGVVFDIPGKTINRIAVVQADDGTFSIIGYLVVNTNVQKKVAKTNIQAGDLHDAFLGMVQRTA